VKNPPKSLDEILASPAARRRQTAREREAKRHNHRERVRKALLNGELSAEQIRDGFALSDAEVRTLLADYRKAGANLVQHGDLWSIDRHMAPDTESAWKIRGKPGKPYRFGLIADTHLGSKHCRLDVCEQLYDWFAEQGIGIVLHAGNWIEGEARFNKHELVPEAHGMQQQLDYFVEHYPQRDGIETRYVAGDDHEGWYAQREGVEIGRMLQDTARRAGRTDLVYLGYKEAFITLEHPRTGKHARVLLDHPGGGSSYAVSYAPQKRVEAAQGGEKPAIWIFGHWHKAGYIIVRGVHCVLVPCTKDLDTFGRKKGLEYVVGGQIIEAWQDEGGAITGFNFQQRLFFDRGYHNQQFSLSGPSEKRATR
jgi:predicted phosphodiesterase